MVAMYHCFQSPDVVSDWADGRIEGLGDALPDDAVPIVVSLQKKQYQYLWEPLFDALDYEPDESEYDDEGGYPTIDVIKDAVGDRTVAFFMDELEDFFQALKGQRKGANKGFLQALLETSTSPDTELYSFVSVLREGSDVHDILSRQQRVEVNMSNQVDIREVLRHRLVDSINDRSAMRTLVDQYIEAYADTDYVDLPDGLREEMYDTYPFHPILIDSLKTRYFAETESGATRGMLYLFAKVLVDQYQDTDLITHGAVDAVEYNDELTRINVEHSRPDRCYDDIRERLADADISYGRPILSTVLIYSLTPGLAEGATTSDIVIGTYHAGDRINDIIVDLERLQGEVYHLWRSDDRYVIREDENPRSLVKNAARDVDDEDAIELVGDKVETLFGSGAHAVGFNVDGELENVPDSQNIKTVVKNGPWDEDSVGEIIKNQPAGRQWRNTLVFVQPKNGKTISPTSQQEKFLGKAKEVIGAEIRKQDENLADEIREEIAKLHDEYEDDLLERLESAYGEIIDGDDLLNEFDYAAEMSLENFVATEPVLNASNIAAAAEADPFDLQRHVWDIVRDRLDSRSETTIDDIYEQFLMDPTYPIPGSVQAVVNAVEDGLEDKPILAHDGSGFKDELRGLTQDTVLVLENDVEKWSTEEVESELRGRFGAGKKEVDLEQFELDLRKRTDVWIHDQDPKDAVMMAAGRLTNEDHYVLVSGNEILDKVRWDATLRDVSDAETIGPNEVRDRFEETVDAAGEADTSQVLTTIRNDTEVYLPQDNTESAFRSAVSTLLSEGYKLKTGGDYVSTLGDRDPTSVVVAPMVPDDIGERILNYIGDLEEEATFQVQSIQSDCAAGEPEAAVKHFLLSNLGKEDPHYVVGATGSEDPADWFPGAGFRIPPEEGWTFEYQGDSPAEMRQEWNESHESGSVSYGSLSFNTEGEDAAPGGLQGVAEFQQAHTDLQLELGQSHEIVADILENIPESATSIDITIQFE
ncbi:ATPase (AAA+ superfamily)-like protein [Halobiforma lacisalsi AJ5]|nr:ATPase (AAA+ superfamily)-like protein [Halobiforma lacisalsi AJ5]